MPYRFRLIHRLPLTGETLPPALNWVRGKLILSRSDNYRVYNYSTVEGFKYLSDSEAITGGTAHEIVDGGQFIFSRLGSGGIDIWDFDGNELTKIDNDATYVTNSLLGIPEDNAILIIPIAGSVVAAEYSGGSFNVLNTLAISSGVKFARNVGASPEFFLSDNGNVARSVRWNSVARTIGYGALFASGYTAPAQYIAVDPTTENTIVFVHMPNNSPSGLNGTLAWYKYNSTSYSTQGVVADTSYPEDGFVFKGRFLITLDGTGYSPNSLKLITYGSRGEDKEIQDARGGDGVGHAIMSDEHILAVRSVDGGITFELCSYVPEYIPEIGSGSPEFVDYGDIKLFHGVDYTDIRMGDRDLIRDPGLETAILISLFSDRRADPEDPLPDSESEDLKGWWGDTLDEDGYEIGSKLWLSYRAKSVTEALSEVEERAKDALDWLVEDGVAEAVSVSAERIESDTISLEVRVLRPSTGGTDVYKYEMNWDFQLEVE